MSSDFIGYDCSLGSTANTTSFPCQKDQKHDSTTVKLYKWQWGSNNTTLVKLCQWQFENGAASEVGWLRFGNTLTLLDKINPITSASQSIKEKPCRNCHKMNDLGVGKCWMCEVINP